MHGLAWGNFHLPSEVHAEFAPLGTAQRVLQYRLFAVRNPVGLSVKPQAVVTRRKEVVAPVGEGPHFESVAAEFRTIGAGDAHVLGEHQRSQVGLRPLFQADASGKRIPLFGVRAHRHKELVQAGVGRQADHALVGLAFGGAFARPVHRRSRQGYFVGCHDPIAPLKPCGDLGLGAWNALDVA